MTSGATTLILAVRLGAQAVPDSTPTVVGWGQLGLGTAAVVAVAALDPTIARAIHGNESAGTLNTAHQLQRFGEIEVIGPVVGGLAVAGLVTHHNVLVQLALRTAGAVAVASIATQGLKHVVGRVRPYGDADLDATDFSLATGDPAFPSGHATAAFALATSLGDAIGTTWARVGLYGLATGTAWARMAEEAHWLSDVVAGAALGVVSAKWVSGRLRFLGMRTPRVLYTPHGPALGWMLPIPKALTR